MKIIGKPYSGKLNVRFDEGELEIELAATTPALYSTCTPQKRTPICCLRAPMIGCFNIMLILNLCPLPTHPKRGIVCQTDVMASEEDSAKYLFAG